MMTAKPDQEKRFDWVAHLSRQCTGLCAAGMQSADASQTLWETVFVSLVKLA